MDIQSELKRLQREIAQALHEEVIAENAAKDAIISYNEKLAKWEADNQVIVTAKNAAVASKAEASAKLKALREQAKIFLSEKMFDDLPEGFTQKRSKVVLYDKQGFIIQALQYFPHLLELNEAAVQDFFTNAAKEQSDGALVLPENIRRFAAVEVVYKPKAEISDAKLSKLVFDEPKAVEAWTPPANAIAILTAPEVAKTLIDTKPLPERGMEDTDELPAIDDDDSSQDESMPVNKRIFNDDKTWVNPSLWDEEEAEPERELAGAFKVPPTNEITF